MSTIEETLGELADEFDVLGDWEERYRYVIDLGKTLEPLSDEEHSDANKVRGCASQVWLVTSAGADGTLIFHGDSDAHIVRGLIAIVISLYSGRTPDEILGFDFRAAFDRLGPGELAARFERADQYLRDAGVFYRKYDGAEGKERAWPLAHVPLIIDETDWMLITRGLVQRAEILEKVVADIYGDNHLVARGVLPPELIGRNPEFLRPMVGIKPASGHYLHFCAFELGRGPDGGWWVLGDRTQAPSGAGFALENRVATTRALSDIYARMNVHRLAGFFRDFRDSLNAEARRTEGRVGILTPGQHNETYFEHAYIARYLGFMLLEGEAKGAEGTVILLAALLVVLVLTLLALLAAGPLMKLVGAKVEAVVTRVLGVLLGALAAQYVIDGLRGSFGL